MCQRQMDSTRILISQQCVADGWPTMHFSGNRALWNFIGMSKSCAKKPSPFWFNRTLGGFCILVCEMHVTRQFTMCYNRVPLSFWKHPHGQDSFRALMRLKSSFRVDFFVCVRHKDAMNYGAQNASFVIIIASFLDLASLIILARIKLTLKILGLWLI